MPLATCSKAARRARAGMLVIPFLVGACKNPVDNGVACTDEVVFGIHGTAFDPLTNTDITSGAYLIATESTYRDSVGASSGGRLLSARERPGVYTVTIGHPGRFPSTRTNVVVRKDECHVIPVIFEAKLFRMSDPGTTF